MQSELTVNRTSRSIVNAFEEDICVFHSASFAWAGPGNPYLDMQMNGGWVLK